MVRDEQPRGCTGQPGMGITQDEWLAGVGTEEPAPPGANESPGCIVQLLPRAPNSCKAEHDSRAGIQRALTTCPGRYLSYGWVKVL